MDGFRSSGCGRKPAEGRGQQVQGERQHHVTLFVHAGSIKKCKKVTKM